MSEAKYDVVGIGNALVDVLSSVPDNFLTRFDLAKGGMKLIGTDDAALIYNVLADTAEISGGSGANTMAGLASLGGRAAYIGKVAYDALGDVFVGNLTEIGVHFDTPPMPKNPEIGTGRCLVLVTEDAERTMCTYLGASATFDARDLDFDKIAGSKVCYLEGYLFDAPPAKHAFYQAATIARQAGRKTALTLSDVFCVERHREDFQHLIEREIDIVFANEAELLALYQIDDVHVALDRLRPHVDIACVTRGEKGSIIVTETDSVDVPASAVGKLIDTTGAGDLYAAGFLYGYTRDFDMAECGRIASIAAAEIISHMGARPETPLASLIARP